MQEVQSIACADVTNLEVGRAVAEMLQNTCDQLTLEKEEKERVDKLEQGLTTIYDRILDIVQAPERSAEEKINISQKIEEYRQEIEELKENLNPTTPPEVQEQREQQSAHHIAEMAKEAREVTELFDRTT